MARKIDASRRSSGYLVRGGDPDAIDSIVPMAYGNLALDLVLGKVHGRLVVLKNGRYDNMPIDMVTATKKVVNVKEHYNMERLRPFYKSFEMKPLFIMTSEADISRLVCNCKSPGAIPGFLLLPLNQ